MFLYQKIQPELEVLLRPAWFGISTGALFRRVDTQCSKSTLIKSLWDMEEKGLVRCREHASIHSEHLWYWKETLNNQKIREAQDPRHLEDRLADWETQSFALQRLLSRHGIHIRVDDRIHGTRVCVEQHTLEELTAFIRRLLGV